MTKTTATIGNGTAVHAVSYDVEVHGILALALSDGRKIAASTACGQVAGQGFSTRRVPTQDERPVTCKKCLARA